jgi:hypothetical protein
MYFVLIALGVAFQPASVQDTVVLRPHGTVGLASGADAYQFGFVTDIAADSDGNLYVVDRVALRVQVYDTTGVHVRTIGREGGGPGEFRFPRQIAVSVTNRLVVSDEGRRQFSVFTTSGEYLASAPLSGGSHYFDGIHLDRDGWIYDGRQGWGQRQRDAYVVLTRASSPETRADSVVVPIPRPETETVGISGPTGYSGYVEQPLSMRTLWTVLPDGTVAATTGERCEVSLRHRTGSVHRLTCGVPRHRASRAEQQRALAAARERVRENAELAGVPPRPLERQLVRPTHHPRFLALVADQRGRLWGIAPAPRSQDVFLVWLNAEGEAGPVSRLVLPAGTLVEGTAIGGRWLYMRARDELGVDRVVRYRLPLDID